MLSFECCSFDIFDHNRNHLCSASCWKDVVCFLAEANNPVSWYSIQMTLSCNACDFLLDVMEVVDDEDPA